MPSLMAKHVEGQEGLPSQASRGHAPARVSDIHHTAHVLQHQSPSNCTEVTHKLQLQ